MLPENEELITPELRRYWLLGGRIVVYQPMPGGENTIEDWYHAVLNGVYNWPAGRPYLEIHDMRDAQANPANQKRALDLVRRISFRKGRSAAIIAPSESGQKIAYFVNHVFVPLSGKIERRAFYTMQEAVDWLRELIQDET